MAKLRILISLTTSDNDYQIEQAHSAEDAARFSFSAPSEVVDAWRSRVLCSREPATALVVMVLGPLPAHMAAVIDLSESPASGPLEVRTDGDAILVGRAPWSVSSPLVRFPQTGLDGG